jgi:hypothetical protein
VAQHASGQRSGPSKASWLDRAIDTVKPQPGPPRKPAAPPVHESEWHKSVERKQIVPDLSIHDVGLSIFGETPSFRQRPGSNEPIAAAQQKVAHVIINGAELSQQTGKPRPTVHDPVEPSREALRNPAVRVAYESSMHGAREAYLSGHDPTNGAIHLYLNTKPDRSNWKFPGGTPRGLAINTQSGPYDNSFLRGDVPSHSVWVNTYLPDAHDKSPKPRKRK